MRGLRGEGAALLLPETVRERVRAGRALRPEATHYVELVEAEDADDAARTALVANLGDHDGIDGVRARIPQRMAPSVVETSPVPVNAGLAEVEAPWGRLARALENDEPLVGKVLSVSVEPDGARVALVDIEGATGTLRLGPQDVGVKKGDEVGLHLIVFNLKKHRAEFVTLESARRSS
jgi:hypothetical protein